jgi:hypothetical protein
MYDIYSCSPDDRCRYALGRSGPRKLLVIGLNPSTATQEKSDTTVAKVEEVASRAGFDGFVMLNLYPLRATNSRTLPLAANLKAISKNLATIESVVAAESSPVIWAAWGKSIVGRDFFAPSAAEVATRVQPHAPKWQHHGPLTVDGHPRHPSRLSYAWSFAPFDVDAYLKHISTSYRPISEEKPWAV